MTLFARDFCIHIVFQPSILFDVVDSIHFFPPLWEKWLGITGRAIMPLSLFCSFLLGFPFLTNAFIYVVKLWV